ncbi:phenazine biosynthesis protein PhzC [Nocardiopsis rhodophaea]|uniref:Phospho-2-dehydro-3-deoxyheptonate aldolase n=1 Tax=Nocardiopsis rhodophaea TaxID=280238 RepID=A0ABP5F2X8_9ACTN
MPTIPQAPRLGTPQQPPWPFPEALAETRRVLSARTALVTEAESQELLSSLGRATKGEALVLQGGDCAEEFTDAVPSVAHVKVGQLLQLAALMRRANGIDVQPVGRLAGQYAKPRSCDIEQLPDGSSIPVYRGDAVNSPVPSGDARAADPNRLLRAYDASAEVLRAVRATWSAAPQVPRVMCAHEALLLDYEEPLVRPGSRGLYGSSGHFLWIGDRTRSTHGRHIKLGASLTNPIGVKLGPTTAASDAVELARRLNPAGIAGRLTFIVRLGARRVDELLPDLVAAVDRSGVPVLWLCDPMHGNTVPGRAGHKTRLIGDVSYETRAFVRILRRTGQHPGGLHLELTPYGVDECVEDEREATAEQWPRCYRSVCDPRLNAEQAERIVEDFSSQL